MIVDLVLDFVMVSNAFSWFKIFSMSSHNFGENWKLWPVLWEPLGENGITWYFSWPTESDEYFDTHFLCLDFSFFGILIAAVGHGSGYIGPNSLYIHYWSYQDATFIKNWKVPLVFFFYLRKSGFFPIKYRLSRYRYTISLQKFKIRMRGQKLHIAS